MARDNDVVADAVMQAVVFGVTVWSLRRRLEHLEANLMALRVEHALCPPHAHPHQWSSDT